MSFLEVDLKKHLGASDLVKTDENDTIVYAKRLNRDNYTRFVLNREPQASTIVTLVLHRQPNGDYELFSAWIGPATPPFPEDKGETARSRPFWRSHALVWGRQQIQVGSEIENWPW